MGTTLETVYQRWPKTRAPTLQAAGQGQGARPGGAATGRGVGEQQQRWALKDGSAGDGEGRGGDGGEKGARLCSGAGSR